MIYDIRSPYFRKFLAQGGASGRTSTKEVNAMLSQMLQNIKMVSAAPVSATSA